MKPSPSWWLAILVGAAASCPRSTIDLLCPDDACSGHGSCVKTREGRPRCECEPLYASVGLTCVANCLEVDCTLLGGCIVVENAHVCVCDQGYFGVGLECVEAPRTCGGQECSGRGVCVELEERAACICEYGYVPFGLACVPASCNGVSCSGHGACLERAGAPSCVCDFGHVARGLGCVPGDCTLADCSDHGACVTEEGQARCVCDFGYVAVGLECRPEACASEDCSGHGACIDGPGGLACVCDPGYVADGLSCRPGCVELGCSSHGACVQDEGGVRCLCDPGYVADGQSCVRRGTLVDGGLDGGVPEDGGADGSGVDAGAGDGGAAPDGGIDSGASVDSGPDSGLAGDAGAPTVPIDWVLIDVSGTPFTMGSPVTEPARYTDEGEHQVTLTRDFWMMTTEVTQAQFEGVMGYNPSGFPACGPTCPVEQVSWHEFAAYANALSQSEELGECYSCTGSAPNFDCTPSVSYATPYDCPGCRLPTEAEWEYAARGGTTTATYAGELTATHCTDTTLGPLAWFCGNSSDTTHPVGTKTANAFGLSDMLGNVWEWCHDWYGAYPGGAETDPTGAASGSDRVLRGGSWYGIARDARAASRGYDFPDDRYTGRGARLVRSRP